MTSCKDLAERYAEGAIANYGRDGSLTPAILLLNSDQEMECSVMPNLTPENGGMSYAVRAIGGLLGTVFASHWIVLISETWVGRFEEEEKETIRKGDLEKRALGGDTTVHTGLLISVYNVFDLDESYTLTYDVDDSYRRAEFAGAGEGDIADSMRVVSETLVATLAERPEGKAPMSFVQLAIDQLKEYVAAAMINQEAVEDDE